jgi:hypothetical protein
MSPDAVSASARADCQKTKLSLPCARNLAERTSLVQQENGSDDSVGRLLGHEQVAVRLQAAPRKDSSRVFRLRKPFAHVNGIQQS